MSTIVCMNVYTIMPSRVTKMPTHACEHMLAAKLCLIMPAKTLFPPPKCAPLVGKCMPCMIYACLAHPGAYYIALVLFFK